MTLRIHALESHRPRCHHMKHLFLRQMPLALFLLSPVGPELDAPSLSEEILFPRPATDRKMVVNNLSQQNPKTEENKKKSFLLSIFSLTIDISLPFIIFFSCGEKQLKEKKGDLNK